VKTTRVLSVDHAGRAGGSPPGRPSDALDAPFGAQQTTPRCDSDYAPLMNEPYLPDVPVTPIALHPAVPAARARVIAAARDLLAVPDAALERAWPWRDSEADVRYGFYRAYETLEAAGAAVRRALDEADTRRAPGARRVAAATAARWELHAQVLPLDATTLGASPGGGEWTVRQTLGHIVSAQRAYGRFTAWWLLQHDAAPLSRRSPGGALRGHARRGGRG